MAADPALDRIAAAIEEAHSGAGPVTRLQMTAITRRFIDDQLTAYHGRPDELGAAHLSQYAKLTKMAEWMGPTAAVRAFSFFLSSAGTGLYLRRYPAPAAPPVPRKPSGLAGLLLTAGNDGPWLICRTCHGEDQVVGGFDDRTPLNDIVTIGLDHHDRLHAGQR
ncbi:MAG: hypothetical protein ACJ786_12730 [Catenulispora sp.]